MSISSGIHRVLYRAKEASGISAYLRSWQYAVQFNVSIHYQGNEPIMAFIVMPIPQDMPAQRMHDKPMIEPRPDAIGTDPVYGNGYAVWEVILKPGTICQFHECFVVRVLPHAPKMPRYSGFGGYDRMRSQERHAYLRRTPHVDGGDPRITALAAGLRGGCSDPIRIADAMNTYVVRTLRFGKSVAGLCAASDVFDLPEVDCGGFATLFVSLMRSTGIPARVVSGYLIRGNAGIPHIWAEWMLPDGVWVPVDPGMERLAAEGRAYNSGRLGFLGSDRIAASFGEDVSLPHRGSTVTLDTLQRPAVFVGNTPGEQFGVFTESSVTIPKTWRA